MKLFIAFLKAIGLIIFCFGILFLWMTFPWFFVASIAFGLIAIVTIAFYD